MAGTVLEELVVKLTAESEQLRTELQKATKATEASSQKMDKVFSDLEKSSSKSFFDLSQAASTMAGFIGGNVVIGAFNRARDAAKFLFNTIVVDGVAAAGEQEDAMNALNSALMSTGRFSEATSKELLDYAGSLQAASKFGDEAILSSMGLIQTLANLDKDGLKGATQSTLDMAAALNLDLNTATNLVSKALSGNVGALSRYGVQVDAGKTKAETMANVMDALNSKFGGRALAQVNTYGGATTQLSNTWGDATEVVGEAIIKNQTIINVIKEVTAIIQEFTKDAQDNSDTLVQWVGKGVIYAIDGLSALIKTIDYLLIPIRVAIAHFTNMGQTIGAVAAAAVAAANGDFKGAMQIMGEQAEINADRTKEALTSAFTGESGLSSVIGILDRVGAAAESGLGKVAEVAGKNTAAVIEYTDAQKKQIEAGVKLAEQITAEEEMSKSRLESLKAIQNARDADTEGVIAYNALQQEIEKARHESSLENLRLALEAKKLTEEEYQAAREQAEMKHATALRTIENDSAKELAAIRDAQAKADAERWNNALSAGTSALSNLASLQSSKNKEMAAAGKSAAIAQATIDTYRGASGAAAALAGVPVIGPFLAAAAAAAFIAGGLARVAQISGVGLQKGMTSVPGIGTQDNFPAVLAPGERVVDADTNSDLKGFLKNGGQSAPTQVIENHYHFYGPVLDRRESGLAIIEMLNEVNFSTGAAPA